MPHDATVAVPTAISDRDADLDRAADAEVVVSAIDAEIAGQKRCREVLRVVNLGYIEIILYRREQEVGTCRNQSM